MSEPTDENSVDDASAKKEEYSVGDYVELQSKQPRKGIIRFVGKIEAFGDCVGVELDTKIKEGNDGTFNGDSYFKCENGKGTFVKTTKIIKKCEKKETVASIETKQPKNAKKNKDKDSDEKVKKKNGKTKKTEKADPKKAKNSKSKNKKNKKGKVKKAKSPRPQPKSPMSMKRTKSGKSKPIKKRKSKAEALDFTIPSGDNVTVLTKIQFIYSRLNATKSPFKKRTEVMKTAVQLLTDEKCDEETSKFAVNGFKKPFTTQLTDKKVSIHKETFNIVICLCSNHTKQFKSQTPHYLKNCMNFLSHSNVKSSKAAESASKTIVITVTKKDNKQLGVVIAELIRFGTISKNKVIRKHAWQYITVILKRYTDKKSNANNSSKKNKKLKKPPKAVLDALQTGLKQGLSDSDKATQKAAMAVLTSYSLIDEARAERILSRMTPSAKKSYQTLNPRVRTRKASQTSLMRPLTPTTGKKKKKKKKKEKKPDKTDKIDKKNKDKKKTNKDPKDKKKTKKNKKNGDNKDTKKANNETVKGDDDNASKEQTKTKDDEKVDEVTEVEKTEVDDGACDDNSSVTTADSSATDATDATAQTSASDSTDITESTTTVVSDSGASTAVSNDDSDAKVDDDASVEDDDPGYDGTKTGKERHTEQISDLMEDPSQMEQALGVDIPDDDDSDESSSKYLGHPDDDDEDLDDVDSDDDEDDDDDDDDDDESSVDTDIIDSQSSENDARELIESFLDLKDPQINWKMIEFLSKDNMTHLLMSYISRMPRGAPWKENLEIDFNEKIPETLPLYSDEADEIRATQLSYSLMRILSNEHAAETVKSFLLRKCQEICIHALAVFHPLSKGNVYHGRVVLEILLNHWPKSFMAAFANQRHIALLLKIALFRNLHQGNLNSFFLDLICFRPSSSSAKLGQIQPVKSKLISMFVSWKFMDYLLDVACSAKHGDDVATKYGTFFIDMVARCASISEAADLFAGQASNIIDSLMRGLLDAENERSIWHRISCGQTLVQYLDISSRPTIMDPAQAMAGMLGVVAPDPSPNILHPMFFESLQRLHSYIPKMCAMIMNKEKTLVLNSIKLPSLKVEYPLGQVRLNCLELLTVSADFAQFKCGLVLGMLKADFWEALLDMAFIHAHNNMFLCHFRRLIHLSMIFRRRFLKHLFVTGKMLDRFVDFYENQPHPRKTLHGYILQMLWDIYNHDQRDDDDEDEDGNMQDDQDDDNKNDDTTSEQRPSATGSIEYHPDDDDDLNGEGNNNDNNNDGLDGMDATNDMSEMDEDVVLKPNFSKEPEDQWDIVKFFDESDVWKQFIATVSLQMEAQNAAESQVPNMNVATNQQQLDQLLKNLLGPEDEGDSSSDSSSDSDED